jgi:hypothetical protein
MNKSSQVARRLKIAGVLNVCAAIPLALFLIGCKNVDLQQVSDVLAEYQQTPLDEKTVVNGLKEALQVSTRNTVSQTSKSGGYSNNPLIKIVMPEKLSKVESTLKNVGLGSYVDKFELQMNRAAESASVEAKQVFIKSILNMSLTDGWNILKGSDDAATQYFKRTTGSELTDKFRPIITRSMNNVGFYSDYKKLMSSYDKLPFTTKPDLNIENYILEKSLDGLFLMVAAEEKKIRTDPAARVTDLLKKVFSN